MSVTKQTWSAKVGSDAIKLRLAGGSTYVSSVQSDYIQFESLFWGSTPSLEFDMDGISAGDVITLSVSSILEDGTVVTDTKDITVGVSLELEIVATSPGGLDVANTTFAIGDISPETEDDAMWLRLVEPYVYFEGYFDAESLSFVETYLGKLPNDDTWSVTVDGLTISVSCASLTPGVNYRIPLLLGGSGGAGATSFVMSLTVNGEVITKTWIDSDAVECYPWVRVNGTTGEVTLVNE